MSRFGKKTAHKEAAVSLNVMPFVDVFSLLTTFLLFTAVFVSIGVQVVQAPFLSQASAPSTDPAPDERTLQVSVDLSKNAITLKSSWTKDPVEEKSERFFLTGDGYKNLLTALVALKQSSPKTDKVNMFIDDDVTFDEMVPILDVVKLGKAPNQADSQEKVLFPKIVFGSVIL